MNRQFRYRPSPGFALGEVIIAVFVMCMCFIPILLVLTNARTDTSRGVHRLRAMELINEAIDWVVICPFSGLRKLGGYASTGIIPIPSAKGKNRRLEPFVFVEGSGEVYAEDYNALLDRQLLIKPVDDPSGWLREAEVTITWWESGKQHSYGMSVLIADEENPDY
jgi:hypothetical protein